MSQEVKQTRLQIGGAHRWWGFLHTLLPRAWTHPGDEGQTRDSFEQENSVIRYAFVTVLWSLCRGWSKEEKAEGWEAR